MRRLFAFLAGLNVFCALLPDVSPTTRALNAGVAVMVGLLSLIEDRS